MAPKLVSSVAWRLSGLAIMQSRGAFSPCASTRMLHQVQTTRNGCLAPFDRGMLRLHKALWDASAAFHCGDSHYGFEGGYGTLTSFLGGVAPFQACDHAELRRIFTMPLDPHAAPGTNNAKGMFGSV